MSKVWTHMAPQGPTRKVRALQSEKLARNATILLEYVCPKQQCHAVNKELDVYDKLKLHPDQTQSQIIQADNTSSSDDEYLYVLGNSTYSKAHWMVTVGINDIPVTVMIDTGASANIIDEDSFEEIQKHCTIELNSPTKRMFAYGSDSQLTASLWQTLTSVQNTSSLWLQHSWRPRPNQYQSQPNERTANRRRTNCLISQSVQRDRQTQEHTCPITHRWLSRSGRTVSPAHSIPPPKTGFRRTRQSGKSRDYRKSRRSHNMGLSSSHCSKEKWKCSPMCRYEDAKQSHSKRETPQPHGRRSCSQSEWSNGSLTWKLGTTKFHWTETVTTFVTHKDLRSYTRLNFGTNSASETFQNIISDQLRDIPGTLNISDDVIVYEKNITKH